jgi:hypothetical protein
LLDYARQWGAYVMGYTAVERSLQTALQTAAAEHGTDIWRQLQVTAEHPADVHIASLTVDPVE